MTQKFVTVFGEDPSAVSQPVPVAVIPSTLQVVDKTGSVMFTVDTAADLAEVTSNTQAMNAELATMARASVGNDDTGGGGPRVSNPRREGPLPGPPLSLEAHRGDAQQRGLPTTHGPSRNCRTFLTIRFLLHRHR